MFKCVNHAIHTFACSSQQGMDSRSTNNTVSAAHSPYHVTKEIMFSHSNEWGLHRRCTAAGTATANTWTRQQLQMYWQQPRVQAVTALLTSLVCNPWCRVHCIWQLPGSAHHSWSCCSINTHARPHAHPTHTYKAYLCSLLLSLVAVRSARHGPGTVGGKAAQQGVCRGTSSVILTSRYLLMP